MTEKEFERLLSKVQRLQAFTRNVQEQAASLEHEVRIKIESLLCERNELACRVDPFSDSGDSLADFDA